jgi:hypothetical protein
MVLPYYYRKGPEQILIEIDKGGRSANKFRKSQIRKFADLPQM